ncbi:hypothetical protein Tco_0701155 [Tanacetum coccineum]
MPRTIRGNDAEAGSSRSKCSRQFEIVEEMYLMGCDGEIDDMLRIKLRETESNEEIFTSVAWIRAFNIKQPIYAELCNELGLYHADELEDDGFDVYFQGGLLSDDQFNVQEYWLSISIEENLGLSRSHASTIKNLILRVIHKMITYGLCQRTTRLYMTTLRELIDSEGRLIPVDPQPGVPRVGIPRPPRASMQDLYDRMGSMEIRHEAIERMEYRQSYHWDRYQGVFKHMAGVYTVPLQ